MLRLFGVLLPELLEEAVRLLAKAAHVRHSERNEVTLHDMPTVGILHRVLSAFLQHRVVGDGGQREQALLNERAYSYIQPCGSVLPGEIRDLVDTFSNEECASISQFFVETCPLKKGTRLNFTTCNFVRKS